MFSNVKLIYVQFRFMYVHTIMMIEILSEIVEQPIITEGARHLFPEYEVTIAGWYLVSETIERLK